MSEWVPVPDLPFSLRREVATRTKSLPLRTNRVGCCYARQEVVRKCIVLCGRFTPFQKETLTVNGLELTAVDAQGCGKGGEQPGIALKPLRSG